MQSVIDQNIITWQWLYSVLKCRWLTWVWPRVGSLSSSLSIHSNSAWIAGGSEASQVHPRMNHLESHRPRQGFSNLVRISFWKFHFLLFEDKERASRKETEKAPFLPSTQESKTPRTERGDITSHDWKSSSWETCLFSTYCKVHPRTLLSSPTPVPKILLLCL